MCIKHHKTSYVICIYRAENGTGAFRKKTYKRGCSKLLAEEYDHKGWFFEFHMSNPFGLQNQIPHENLHYCLTNPSDGKWRKTGNQFNKQSSKCVCSRYDDCEKCLVTVGKSTCTPRVVRIAACSLSLAPDGWLEGPSMKIAGNYCDDVFAIQSCLPKGFTEVTN